MLASPGIWAEEGPAQSQEGTSAAAIRARYSRVYRQYRQRTLGRKLGAMESRRLAPQRRNVEELIERAEAGQTVTTAEVDRALGLSD